MVDRWFSFNFMKAAINDYRKCIELSKDTNQVRVCKLKQIYLLNLVNRFYETKNKYIKRPLDYHLYKESNLFKTENAGTQAKTLSRKLLEKFPDWIPAKIAKFKLSMGSDVKMKNRIERIIELENQIENHKKEKVSSEKVIESSDKTTHSVPLSTLNEMGKKFKNRKGVYPKSWGGDKWVDEKPQSR